MDVYSYTISLTLSLYIQYLLTRFWIIEYKICSHTIACKIENKVQVIPGSLVHRMKLNRQLTKSCDLARHRGSIYMRPANSRKTTKSEFHSTSSSNILYIICTETQNSKKPLPLSNMMSMMDLTREAGLLVGLGGYHKNVCCFAVALIMCRHKQIVIWSLHLRRVCESSRRSASPTTTWTTASRLSSALSKSQTMIFSPPRSELEENPSDLAVDH